MTASIEEYDDYARAIMRLCLAEEDNQVVHNWAMQELMRLGGTESDDNSLIVWEESFELYKQILAQCAAKAALPESERHVLDWPWGTWNSYIGQMEPGLLAVLAGGDGVGKTIYAESIAEHWAQRGNRVVYVHFELNRKIMLHRRASRHTGLEYKQLTSGKYTPQQQQLIADADRRLLSWVGNISYLHTPGWDMERTLMKLRRMKLDGVCDIVVIDYLEKAAASTRQLKLFGANAYQREADNVEQIKNFTESTETPGLCLAQMSKTGKKQGIGDIDRTGMRGAGEKSEKANVVVLITRKRSEEGYSRMVDVRVDKNTVGRTGNFEQIMSPEYFRVADIYKGEA
jgi:replicative DNA helicase